MPPKCGNPNRRFFSKIRTDYKTGCWIWTGHFYPSGYGVFSVGRKYMKASRFAYAAFTRQPIPPGLFVCHTCDVKACVHPAHLFLGTCKENMEDCVRKGRIATGDRSGARLHPESRVRGENQHFSKLNEAMVREIRAKYVYRSKEFGLAGLASRFSVDICTILDVLKGRTWKHVK